MQYLRQAEQLAEAIKQTADMLKNSKLLPGQVFGTISTDLNALASIVQGGQALSYSLANLDSLFKTRFPGYGYSGTGYYTQLSKLVANFAGHDTRRASRGGFAGPAASE